MSFPVFDLHCDTALALLGPKYYADGLLRENKFHIDLLRMKQFPAYAQCFACFSSPLEPLPGKMTIEDMFEREISVLLREWNGNADLIDQIYTPAEIIQNAAKCKYINAFWVDACWFDGAFRTGVGLCRARLICDMFAQTGLLSCEKPNDEGFRCTLTAAPGMKIDLTAAPLYRKLLGLFGM